MPRAQSPEIVTGARGPRGPENVTMVADQAEFRPQVKGYAKEGDAHFVSRFREYHVLIATAPDVVTAQGQIVKGRNKSVRFKDFNLVSHDPEVIEKIRSMKEYGINREVWEKHQQDEVLAQRSIEAAEAAIEALPPERQAELMEKLTARFNTFPLPQVNGSEENMAANPEGEDPEVAALLKESESEGESASA